MKPTFGLTLILIALTQQFALAQKIWTLTDCITYAIENNIQVRQAEIDSRIAEGRLTQSKHELMPDFTLSGSDRLNYGKTVIPITNELAETRIRSSNFQANAQVDIFRGFQNINSIRKNTSDYLASRYDVDKMRNDITIAVTNAYLLILFNMELEDMSIQQTLVTSEQITRIEKLVASGALPKGNILELQAQLAAEELQLINAQNQIVLAHLNLVQLLQLEGDTELEIEKPVFDSTQLAMEIIPASDVYLTSLTLMPQIKSAELKVQSSERNLLISQAGRVPVLSLGGSLGTGYSEGSFQPYFEQLGDNTYRNIGLSIFIPIYSKNTVQQSIKQARLQVERAQYSLLLEKNQLRKNVESAYADAEAALKSYYANKKALVALTESFKYAEKRFDAGLINSVDYNTNKNNLRRAESELAQSKYEYVFKRKILDFFQGRPITF